MIKKKAASRTRLRYEYVVGEMKYVVGEMKYVVCEIKVSFVK